MHSADDFVMCLGVFNVPHWLAYDAVHIVYGVGQGNICCMYYFYD